ncbi:DUF3817 domain-containing protein [Actinomadura sp. 3N508]|uniref:DUF3817 domain-containing protein n=1 Tax=Actinomadura sp. 3N508 TaxID=3375153 RepID=UPI00379617AA
MPAKSSSLSDLGERNSVFWFRVVTLAEGWSFVVLLIFGSVLSRVSDIDLVQPLGMLHGVLVIAWGLVFLAARRRLGWGVKPSLLAVLACLLPLTPFVFHRSKRAELLRAEAQA